MTFTVWQVAAIMLAQGVLSELAAWAVRAWKRAAVVVAWTEAEAASTAAVDRALRAFTDEDWAVVLDITRPGA